MAKIVRENSFEGGAGAGHLGTINYSTGYGTPGGGNNTQGLDKFSSSDKTVNHMNNQSSSSVSPIPKLPERPDRVSSSGSPIHPAAMSDKGDFEDSSPEPIGSDSNKRNTVSFDSGGNIPDDNTSTDDPDTKNIDPDNKPIDPTKGLDAEVDKLFTKRITPTPDEILAGLQYEMSNMVKKDKHIAKQMVIKNLKQDPTYYSRLGMLNIDDKKMKIDEDVELPKKTIFKVIRDGEIMYIAHYNSDPAKSVLSGLHNLNMDVVKDLVEKGWKIKDLTLIQKDLMYENKETVAKTKEVLDQMIKSKEVRQENTTFSKTKSVLDQMIAARHKTPVQNSKEINSIFGELWEKRHGYGDRK